MTELRRSTDKGLLCALALRAGQFWDFIDKRAIDKHLMAWGMFFITWYLLDWTLDYIYQHPQKSGLEIGAIVAAYMVPWTPLQAAVIKWYFEARPQSQ